MSDSFYPTEELKKASLMKPIVSYIPEDGKDPDPSWDVIARSLWPSTVDEKTSREALAHELMFATYDPTLRDVAPTVVIVMSRMCQRLMGDVWMDRWLWDNQFILKRRIDYNRRQFGVGFISKFFRKWF
jgi:hypothetical protein